MTCLDDSSLPFLHGTLVIRVEEARDLPDNDRLELFDIDSENIDLIITALGGTAVRMLLMPL